MSFNMAIQKAFDICICNACRKEHAKYDMMTKTTAKTEYLLSDTDIAPLKYLERKNPRKQAWGMMKLYMKTDVVVVAQKKYGSMEGVERERRKRVCVDDDPVVCLFVFLLSCFVLHCTIVFDTPLYYQCIYVLTAY
jgi:DNA repair protein